MIESKKKKDMSKDAYRVPAEGSGRERPSETANCFVEKVREKRRADLIHTVYREEGENT